MIFGNKEQILYGNRFNGTKGNGYQPIKKEQTNEEYMQTCSSDELANTIFRLIVHGTVIRPDREYIKKWLKEKHDDLS